MVAGPPLLVTGFPPERKTSSMDYLDNLARQRIEGNGTSLPDDPASLEQFPCLWEMLTCRLVLGDKAKLPARLSVQVGMGCWAIALSDESLAISIDTTAPTLSEAFGAMERALASGAGWREYRKRQPKLRQLSEEEKKGSGHKRKK